MCPETGPRKATTEKKEKKGLHLSSNKSKRITITRRSNLNSNKWLRISNKERFRVAAFDSATGFLALEMARIFQQLNQLPDRINGIKVHTVNGEWNTECLDEHRGKKR